MIVRFLALNLGSLVLALAAQASPIVVAVVDTGVDIAHQHIKNRIWTNPGETGRDSLGRDRRSNGKDDDGNGYIDDVHGWDFATSSPVISDEHGHGTHVAGLILSESNGRNVQIMSLKFFEPGASGRSTLEASNRALRYAIDNGANLINFSGGGRQPSIEESRLLREAEKNGILVIAAAGNDAQDSDRNGYFPADYGFGNIVSVTAVNNSGEYQKFANFGSGSVDLAAPGLNVLSSLPGNRWGRMTGTSQSTAIVSGRLAGILAQMADRDLSPEPRRPSRGPANTAPADPLADRSPVALLLAQTLNSESLTDRTRTGRWLPPQRRLR